MYIVQFVTTVVVDAESGEQAANVAVAEVKAIAEKTSSDIKQLEVSKSINYRNFHKDALEPNDHLRAEYSESEHKIVCDTCRWEAHEERNAESDHNYGERNASCCVFCDTKVFDSSDTIDQVLDENGRVPEVYGGSMDGRA